MLGEKPDATGAKESTILRGETATLPNNAVQNYRRQVAGW